MATSRSPRRPVLGAVAVGAFLVAPLRIPLFAIVFLCLGLDAVAEGPWDSPFAPIGRVLVQNLNKTVPGAGLPFQFFAAMFVLLLLLHAYRRLTGSQIDSLAFRGFARPLPVAMACSLLVVLAEVANGVARGGDIQMAKIQVQNFILTLLLAYLLAERVARYPRLQGSRSAGARRRLRQGCSWPSGCTSRCCRRWSPGRKWRRRTATRCSLQPPRSCCCRGSTNSRTAAARSCASVFLPLLFARNGRQQPATRVGANSRAAIAGAVSRQPSHPTQAAHHAKPAVLGARRCSMYVAVGWNSPARIFAPVKIYRSVGDGQVDSSTMYRDLENFNLIQMLKDNPIVGSGFGHPYKIVVVMPDISFFTEWRYMPHNSVLGLWAFTGWLGFTGPVHRRGRRGVLCRTKLRDGAVARRSDRRVHGARRDPDLLGAVLGRHRILRTDAHFPRRSCDRRRRRDSRSRPARGARSRAATE